MKVESRLYGIVLLSDGEDTVGAPIENQMFVTCLPANAELLGRLATVTGGRMYTADPPSISNVYISISAEQ